MLYSAVCSQFLQMLKVYRDFSTTELWLHPSCLIWIHIHGLLLDKKWKDLSQRILLPAAGCRHCVELGKRRKGADFSSHTWGPAQDPVVPWAGQWQEAQCKDTEARFWWKLKRVCAPTGKEQQLCQRLCRPQFLIPQGPVCSDTTALAKCLFLLLCFTASGTPNSSAKESPAHRAHAQAGHPHHPME